MTTTKKRSPSSVLVQKESIDQAGSMLLKLPEKPKESWSLREAIELLSDSISGALQRGYSHEEIAAMLSDKGVKISPSSLKSYLAATRKEKDGASRTRKVTRGRRKASAPSVASEAVVEPVAAPVAAEQSATEAPAKKRGTRSTTATRTRTAAKTKPKSASRTTGTRTTQSTTTRTTRGRKKKEA